MVRPGSTHINIDAYFYIRSGGNSLKSRSAITRKWADDERKRRDSATSESPSFFGSWSVAWDSYGRDWSSCFDFFPFFFPNEKNFLKNPILKIKSVSRKDREQKRESSQRAWRALRSWKSTRGEIDRDEVEQVTLRRDCLDAGRRHKISTLDHVKGN